MKNEHQRTAQWLKDREGKLTASSFGAAAGLGPGSRQQLWRVLMGLEEIEENPAMSWGKEHEPIALDAYANHHVEDWRRRVALTGFVQHPELGWMGCSPDALVDEDGLGEVKCPVSQQLYESVPPYYMAQMQGQMEITNRNWCEFIVWTPGRMSVQRVLRCREYWRWLHVRLAEFWIYVEACCEPPRMKRDAPPPTEHLLCKQLIYPLNHTI